MDNYVGMKLDGRYQLLELIGTGGMAEIYKADDVAEDKTVAVKILKNEFAGSEEFLRRFRNESKAIALLSHTNIVKIFDVGFTDRVQFIVMEYIDGITLIEYIERQGVLKWRDALGFTGQVLKALQHAHDRGIVHRDVKSQNIMLLRDGTIKVMDFGIARFNREIDKTMSEKAIGSVHYISPEQARGDNTDEKSDLYSVGVMLYEMLTGVKPFDGDDALSIALMHTKETPKPPSEINAAIPKGLEEITLRAMQKEPAKRYQTAGEMLGDLKEFDKNPSIVFEYKYAAPDGGGKYFDKGGKPIANAAAAALQPTPGKNGGNDGYEDGYEDDDYDDDEVIERRSPLLPILFAVASAFVILTAVLITLIVSNGLTGSDNNSGLFASRNRRMPDLLGMDYSDVEREYRWLRMEPQQVFSADFPKNTIMSQDVPAERMINPGQTVVKVVVSKGREIIFMPDFTRNLTPGDEVLAELARLGLRPTPVRIFHDEVPFGFFIRSDRSPNDELNKGDDVRVWISDGREDALWNTVVPNMVGLSEVAAKQKATDSKITLEILREESTEEQLGLVVRQSTEPDEEVDNWTVVEIFIGSGPAEIPEDEREREFSIGFNIPDGWGGEYTFRHFINGVYQPDLTVVIDIGIRREYVWTFTDSGEKRRYSIRIRSEVTGNEELYADYEIDFTTEPPTFEIVERNLNVLEDISRPQ
ncbi:MAG: Stk1 family PASTA domain-containing Ser/Thr kinase [Oscillospiraceae bacterium]|nr:Stk1 family PASTA domain-containing Ser/Thr kinase [Oscillospiraceae bacterium]